MTIRALIEAVDRGEWTVTHWRDFAAVPTGNDDTPGPILAHRAFHGSLDAALALHEALLPGWGWTVGPWGARVFLYSDGPRWDGSKRQEVELVDLSARAFLLAILRAAEAESQP